MNTENARFNMIEQQIRPWGISDLTVLEQLHNLHREDFVPLAYRNFAFADLNIPLPNGQTMLAPKVEARVLQALAVQEGDSVLVIGAGTGYVAGLLALHAQHVIALELDAEIAALAEKNLRAAHIQNVEIIQADGAQGWPKAGPYDVIMVCGGLPLLPQTLLQQLKLGGRLAAFVGLAPILQTQLVTRVEEAQYDTLTLFETWIAPLKYAKQPPIALTSV